MLDMLKSVRSQSPVIADVRKRAQCPASYVEMRYMPRQDFHKPRVGCWVRRLYCPQACAKSRLSIPEHIAEKIWSATRQHLVRGMLCSRPYSDVVRVSVRDSASGSRRSESRLYVNRISWIQSAHWMLSLLFFFWSAAAQSSIAWILYIALSLKSAYALDLCAFLLA